jgi:hypothetical protein
MYPRLNASRDDFGPPKLFAYSIHPNAEDRNVFSVKLVTCPAP